LSSHKIISPSFITYFAVHDHTAAELIYKRADAAKEHMGLTSWDNSPGGRIVKSDVGIAKNYLTESELQNLVMYQTSLHPNSSIFMSKPKRITCIAQDFE
jgi:hypothetical protein